MQRYYRLTFLLFALLAVCCLSACGSEKRVETSSTVLRGSLGVSLKRATALSPQSQISLLSLKSLNQDLRRFGEPSVIQPLRGLNAALLGNLLGQASSNQPLFSLRGQYIFAVNDAGEVVAEAIIQQDGSWSLEIDNQLWQKAKTLGLFQGYKSQEGYVCEKPLELEDKEGQRRQASFVFKQSQLKMSSSEAWELGAFYFHPETGKPTGFSQLAELEPGPEFSTNCNGETIVSVQVSADFNWQTPSGFSEARLYETGVGFAIDTRDLNEPKFVNVSPLDQEGKMDMVIHKPKNDSIPLALVMSDTELTKLDTLDLRQVKMPLTPTFDLNAAIRYGNPEEPATVPVGDDGYSYDPSLTTGGMAMLKGKVFDKGQVAKNALILGVIDSAEVIAFNLAISQDDGSYELWLPATDKNLPYYVIALSEDAKALGKPINVPPFRGDAAELRYVLSSAQAYEGADIYLQEKLTEDSNAGDITGTVRVPEGQTVEGVSIYACTPDYATCPVVTTVKGSARSSSFSLKQVPAGDYMVVAKKDLNEDGVADLQGAYTASSSQPVLLSPPASDIIIELSDLRNDQAKAEVTVLRPSDFSDGQVSLTLDALAKDESVVVIPVYASQTLLPDTFGYELEVSGIEGQGLGAQAQLQPESESWSYEAQAHTEHLNFLETASDLMVRLQTEGLKPLAQADRAGLTSQVFDRCPAPYSVGKTCEFWVMSAGQFIPITATLTQVSSHAYWFIQNEDLADFSKTELASLAQSFENVTVSTNAKYFGTFADIDQNGKIFMIFSHLLAQDDLLGYVAPWDYYRDTDVSPYGVRSNEGDIFYAATPDSFKQFMSRTVFFNKVMPSTMTHELKHLVAQGYRFMNNLPVEELWLEEPTAVAAEELAGQGSAFGGAQGSSRFALRNPEQYRIVYEGRPANNQENLSIYGYNFMLLWQNGERMGHDKFWRNLVQQNAIGVANLEASAAKPLTELMLDWAPALLFDNTFLLEGYEYESLNLRDGSWQKLAYKPLVSGQGSTRSVAYYLGKGMGLDATVKIETKHPDPFVIVIRFKGGLP